MLEHTIIKTKGKRPVPLVLFEDEHYEIVSAFLLSEARSFSSEIESGLRSLLEEGTEYKFSGNVYTLSADMNETLITDDISESEKSITVPTKELYELVVEYRKEYKKLRG